MSFRHILENQLSSRLADLFLQVTALQQLAPFPLVLDAVLDQEGWIERVHSQVVMVVGGQVHPHLLVCRNALVCWVEELAITTLDEALLEA